MGGWGVAKRGRGVKHAADRVIEERERALGEEGIQYVSTRKSEEAILRGDKSRGTWEKGEICQIRPAWVDGPKLDKTRPQRGFGFRQIQFQQWGGGTFSVTFSTGKCRRAADDRRISEIDAQRSVGGVGLWC